MNEPSETPRTDKLFARTPTFLLSIGRVADLARTLEKELAAKTAEVERLQKALLQASMLCGNCDGSGQDNDGENYLNAPCPKCKFITEALNPASPP